MNSEHYRRIHDEEIRSILTENQLLQKENESLQNQVKNLEAFSQTLLSENEALQHRIQELEMEEENNQQESTGGSKKRKSPPDEIANDDSSNTIRGPIYGNRDKPILTPKYGLIDGRSNSQAAFEQKCNLLREWINEFGHCRVPRKPANDKYLNLAVFVMKQRKWYKMFMRGENSCMTEERIQILNDIGIDWHDVKEPAEIWPEYYEQLKDFKKKHGHCCVQAVPGVDAEFSSWVSNQKRILKLVKKKEKEEAKSNLDRSDDSADDNEEMENGDALNANQENVTDENEADRKEDTNRKKYDIPGFWDRDHRSKIQDLGCHWLNSEDEEIRESFKRHKWPRSGLVCTLHHSQWYHCFEELKKYVVEHGKGPVFVQNGKITGLSKWIAQQRMVYDEIENGNLESTPVLKSTIKLLKDHKFVFDKDLIKKETDAIKQKQVEEIIKANEKDSPQAKLEAAKKSADEAKNYVSVAKKRVDEAKKEVKMAEQRAREAKLKFVRMSENNPVGKLVIVKARGDKKPGGMGRVTRVFSTKIVNTLSFFYDVEYLEGEIKKENSIDGIFVTFQDADKAQLEEAQALLNLKKA